MNRSVMGRQMFRNGGAAGLKPIPEGNMGLPNLPEGVRNNMGYMAMGGDPMMMPEAAQGIMATAPAMGAPSPEMLAQEGANMMDPNTVANMVEGASAAGYSDPEQAGSFEEMMNSVSGDNKSAEERRTDLASIVGPEDAGQTPESVLALVTPVVELALVDQGIGPMAQETMNTPVEGDMGQGIMTMAANGNMGVGNEPPVNFNLGGEVRRRGDEDPVPVFEQGGPVQYFKKAGVVAPMTDYSLDLGADIAQLKPVFEQYMPKTDPDVRKDNLQSDILFDVANTFLAFATPMEGEKSGLSAAERLALATQKTQLLPKIQQRTAKSLAEAKAEDKAPTAAAINAAIQFSAKKLDLIKGERIQVFKNTAELLKQSRKIRAESYLQEDKQKHAMDLQKSEYGLKTLLDKLNKSLDFKYDTKLADQKTDAEKELKQVQAKIDENQIEIKHTNLVKIENNKLQGRKDIQTMSDVAAMARTNANNVSSEGIATANNQTKKQISNENNTVKKLIAENRLEFNKNELQFKKVQELIDQSQLAIENSLNADKFNLETQKLEAQKLRDFLSNERAKEAGFRDERRVKLAARRLEEIDAATLQFNKFKDLKGMALNKAKFEFNKTQEANKVRYQNEQVAISQRLNGIKAAKNALEQSKFTFEKQAANLDKFGKTLDARTLAYISSQSMLDAYSKGENNQSSNEINALVTQYISPQPRWDDQTNSFVMRTNKLPEEFLNAVKQRSQTTGANLPTGIENISGSKKPSDTTDTVDERLIKQDFMGTGKSVNLTDLNIPKMPIDLSKTGATGSGDFLGNVVNLAFETVALGQPYQGTATAKKDLDAINVDLVNVILGDRTGKSAQDERNEIRRILPDVSAFIGGDETAAGKIRSTLNFIDRKLETETTGLKQLYQSKSDFSSAAQRVLRLKQLKAGYQQFLDAYNLSKGGGKEKAPLSSFLKGK